MVFWSLISKKSSNRGALDKSVYCDLSFDGKEMRPLSPKRLTLTYILEGTDFNQKSQTFAGYWLWLKKTSFLDTLQIWKIGKIYWFQLSIYTTLCSQYVRHSINHNFSFCKCLLPAMAAAFFHWVACNFLAAWFMHLHFPWDILHTIWSYKKWC